MCSLCYVNGIYLNRYVYTMEKDMEILIRKATTSDLDLVTHIEATCFPPAEAAP